MGTHGIGQPFNGKVPFKEIKAEHRLISLVWTLKAPERARGSKECGITKLCLDRVRRCTRMND